MNEIFRSVEEAQPAHVVVWADRVSGLRAFLVLDDLTLGPAAGGIRTRRYPSAVAALEDATRLARAMTLKCALAGLPAGGGKVVVWEPDEWDRPEAFRSLGERIDQLGGLFRTAGDLGTSHDDLLAVASRTSYVHTDEAGLTRAAARGLLRALEACVERRGRGVGSVRVAVQGCGAIGAATAAVLAAHGATVAVADLDEARARRVSAQTGAEILDPDTILESDVDVVMPCAMGGVLTAPVAARLRAWAVCGGANNVLGDADAEAVLVDRGILFVPDVVASAGAVIEGIGGSIMGLEDRTALIDRIRTSAAYVLETAAAGGSRPTRVADRLARQRLDAARARHP